MERHTLFADVILPLALPRILTYRVPGEWNELVVPGKRVVVQLGKSKLYTGIIRVIHERAPVAYEARYLESVLDDMPVVLEKQLAFWEWLASYYCCTVGEVMNAALPGGLKLSSETRFAIAVDDWREQFTLTDRETQVLESLSDKSLSIPEIAEILGLRSVQPILKRLIEKGLIHSEEELRERYKPRTEEWLSIGPAADDEQKLQSVFQQLEKSRAKKQSDILLSFLQLSGFDGGHSKPVPRKVLMSRLGINSAGISALVTKNILLQTTRELASPESLLSDKELPILSENQNIALQEIRSHLSEHEITLLHGVTSSGKTEIYCHLIDHYLREGKQVLFLLPEIALTTQLIGRLRRYFEDKVLVFHSGFSENQRSETWMRLMKADPTAPFVVIGARSALFVPLKKAGLIIIDEEHESSFKQQDPAPRYHARDAAIMWARQTGARVVLGSATPSIESYWNAKQGRYGLVTLSERYGGVDLPEIRIADIREDLKKKTMHSHFTSPLYKAIQEAIAAKDQVILFQNRRGYSPLWQCNTCGWVSMCTRCDVSMTYHKQVHQLKCHYCGYTTSPPDLCGACGSHDLRMLGFGTEKIEEDVQTLFPDVRVQRMDLDTTRNKTGYQRIIQDFESGDIQILVGTQMITKGLDFERVAVVGILNADRMMNYPDFRSMERSYQLMMQVAGRAGRREKRGTVFVQTYTPEHWLLELIRTGNYGELYEKEIRERFHFGYPPFIRLIRITLRHKEDSVAGTAAEKLAEMIRNRKDLQVLGPERPYIPRINNLYLRQILIKLERSPELAQAKHHIVMAGHTLRQIQDFKSIRLTIDVDPV